jgi:hypothetical protein
MTWFSSVLPGKCHNHLLPNHNVVTIHNHCFISSNYRTHAVETTILDNLRIKYSPCYTPKCSTLTTDVRFTEEIKCFSNTVNDSIHSY